MVTAAISVYAAPPARPVLNVSTSGLDVEITWSAEGATGYTFFYAPYPDAEYIDSVDLGLLTSASGTLWDGAAFYVAVQAYNTDGTSEYSNVEYFILEAFQLESTAFADGESIPDRYTCVGQNVSPPLSWSGAPSGTRSFVLLMDDPDAPGGTFKHWAAYDIPAETAGLQEGIPPQPEVEQLKQARNDFGRFGYGGPCPPVGHGVHRYHFRLLSLDVETLGLSSGMPFRDVEEAVVSHTLAEAELIGTYSR
ncbi:MAG: YbhB/YbcL family Raf kinase inhibitor-like protein [Deltaproteobacteria bacterium]|nr:YbhB/YbcL family Raf kinase inhibitor-like protein [Deltaproteobacteria bacterium]MBW2309055.1 YbhB/YbcL family Raf kinase inhibitor-like protein [Deltaproteobacteria bacterium]